MSEPRGRNASGGLAVGVDIGGTNMRAALIDHSGTIIDRLKRPAPSRDGLGGVDQVVGIVVDLVAAQHVSTGAIEGAGIGIPGWVDRVTGKFRFAPKLAQWQDLPVQAHLEEQLGCPVQLETDPRAATIGELWLGAGRGRRDFVLVTVGTGIGCGIVVDGKLCTGHHGFGAELGHTVVDLSRAKASETHCACGTPGCLESLAAGPAIARAGQEAAKSGAAPGLLTLAEGRPDQVTAEVVVRAAQRGEGAAREIVTQAGEYLGVGIANLVCLVEPELVAIGGGLSEVGELLLRPIRGAMEKWCYLIARDYIVVQLVRARLGDDAGVIGAAKVAFDRSRHNT